MINENQKNVFRIKRPEKIVFLKDVERTVVIHHSVNRAFKIDKFCKHYIGLDSDI